METFATILSAWMNARPESPRPAKTPFEDAVDAFEARVASSLLEDAAISTDAAAWAAELGIAFPCSDADLKLAFRRRVFETHPDRHGGSHVAFLRMFAAFEEARAALKTSPKAAMTAPLRTAHSRYRQTMTMRDDAPSRVRSA